MKIPLVSIIIPTKNEENNLPRLLKSIQRQSYALIEVIVVDNFSTDRTLKLAKKFTDKIYSQGNERSSQRNFGAQKAKGKYLLFVDADMTFSKKVIGECVEIIGQQSKAVIVIEEKSQAKTLLGKALALEKSCYQNGLTLIHSARFFPKKDFLKLGGYDRKLIAAEDWDLTQRFVNKGYKVIKTKKSYLTHFESTANLLTQINKEIYYLKNLHRYQSKHPNLFKQQQKPFYRGQIYLQSWRKLASQPLLTLTFLSYKTFVWLIWTIYSLVAAR